MIVEFCRTCGCIEPQLVFGLITNYCHNLDFQMTQHKKSQELDAALEAQKQKHYAGIFIVLWSILSVVGVLIMNQVAPDWMFLGGFAGLIIAVVLAKLIVR